MNILRSSDRIKDEAILHDAFRDINYRAADAPNRKLIIDVGFVLIGMYCNRYLESFTGGEKWDRRRVG